MDALPYELRTDHAAYCNAAASATLAVRVTRAQALEISEKLFFDERADGYHGRALSEAVVGVRGPLGLVDLEVGDRLEVGGDISDTHANIEELQVSATGYIAMVFFRARTSVFLSAVNPIFQILRFDHVEVDVLHCVDLGVAQYMAGTVFELLLRRDVYGTGARTRALRLTKGVNLMFKSLCQWYKATDPAPALCAVATQLLAPFSCNAVLQCCSAVF